MYDSDKKLALTYKDNDDSFIPSTEILVLAGDVVISVIETLIELELIEIVCIEKGLYRTAKVR